LAAGFSEVGAAVPPTPEWPTLAAGVAGGVVTAGLGASHPETIATTNAQLRLNRTCFMFFLQELTRKHFAATADVGFNPFASAGTRPIDTRGQASFQQLRELFLRPPRTWL
jgi:hypothetical protein